MRGLLATFFVAAMAAAQAPSDSVLEAQTTMLAAELRCPVCQGNSIQDSPSELAQQMRDVIRDQLRSGKTPDEVRAYFVDKYGEWILLAPKAEGFNLVVYAIPFAAILVGGFIVWRTLRRWTQGPTAAA
jgi:cytochrome c-type biogenesis protein CcmH